MRLMSRGNNVQRRDVVARICAIYKNRVLLKIPAFHERVLLNPFKFNC